MANGYKQLYRSRNNRYLGGVCGGLGEFFGIDPTLVRLIFVFSVFISAVAPAVLIYIIMLLVVPEEPLVGTTPPPASPLDAGAPARSEAAEPADMEVFDSMPPESPGE